MFRVFRVFKVFKVFRVFRVFSVFRVFKVKDILECRRGEPGGGPKMAKIQYGVKPDIFKRAAQKRPKFNMV